MKSSMRAFSCAAFAASLLVPAHATQVAAPQPVAWSVTLDPADGQRPAGSAFAAVVKAAIEEGWHVYTPDELPDGPRPLRIEIPAGQPFTVSGKMTTPEAEREFDQAFGQVTAFYGKDSVFRLPVAIAADAQPGPAVLALDVTFQACDGRMCLPGRTVRLTAPVTIGAAAVVAAAPRQAGTSAGQTARAIAAVSVGVVVPA